MRRSFIIPARWHKAWARKHSCLSPKTQNLPKHNIYVRSGQMHDHNSAGDRVPLYICMYTRARTPTHTRRGNTQRARRESSGGNLILFFTLSGSSARNKTASEWKGKWKQPLARPGDPSSGCVTWAARRLWTDDSLLSEREGSQSKPVSQSCTRDLLLALVSKRLTVLAVQQRRQSQNINMREVISASI